MAETTAAPAASAPAPTPTPAAPAAAPAPATPPLPAGQAASAPKPAGKVPPSNTPPKPPPTIESKLNFDEVMKDAPPSAETPAADPTKEAPPPKPEAKAPDAPPAEKNPFDGMELPANASEAQKSNFKTLKAQAAEEVNRLKNERAALAKELDTYKKSTPADNADLARIQAELKSAQDRLAVFDVSSHPDFQRQYVEPKKKALATATSLLVDNAVEGAPDIHALLDKSRPEFSKALTEAAQKLPLFDQADFMANAREAYRLHGEEKGALSKAGELRASIQAKAAQEARQAFEASRTDFSQKVPVMEIPEGASESVVAEVRAYNQARDAAIAEAEQLTFKPLSERQVADVATQAAALKMVAGHTLPMLQRQLKEARDIITAQNEQLKGIASKKNPGSFAGGAEAPGAQQPKNLQELAKQVFGGQG